MKINTKADISKLMWPVERLPIPEFFMWGEFGLFWLLAFEEFVIKDVGIVTIVWSLVND